MIDLKSFDVLVQFDLGWSQGNNSRGRRSYKMVVLSDGRYLILLSFESQIGKSTMIFSDSIP